MKTGMVLALVLLVGCSSLHRKVSKINNGDPEDRVMSVMGTPDVVRDSVKVQGAKAWYYNGEGETCGFTISDHKVFGSGGCQDLPRAQPDYTAAGQSLQNGGQYFQNRFGPKPTTKCTSTEFGGVMTTNCN